VALVRTIAASGTGVIPVTHDPGTVRALADRIVVLRMGLVVHDGPAHDLTPSELWAHMSGLDGTAAAWQAASV